MSAICKRCAEPLVNPDPTRYCGFCKGELREQAVKILTTAQGPGDRALLERTAAIDTLRVFGYSQEQVLRARAEAFDGRSVAEIVAGFNGAEAVAA